MNLKELRMQAIARKYELKKGKVYFFLKFDRTVEFFLVLKVHGKPYVIRDQYVFQEVTMLSSKKEIIREHFLVSDNMSELTEEVAKHHLKRKKDGRLKYVKNR